MAVPYIEVYKSGANSFPSDSVPLKSRKDKWHLQLAKSVMTEYVNDRCGIRYSDRDRITTNRKFAQGTNSEDDFKNIMLDFDPRLPQEFRKAYNNLDYSIIPIIAKFRRVFIGILSATDYRINATTIDPLSVRKKDITKWKQWIKSFYQKELGQIDQLLGIPEDKGEFLPESKAALEMYNILGGFKLGLEEAIESGMNHCYDVSRWDEEIRPQLIGDLFDNNACVCKDYVDSQTLTVKQRYVDLANWGVLGGTGLTKEHARAFFEIKYYTVADIRVMTGWSEEKLVEVVKAYDSKYGNSQIHSWSPRRVGNTYGPYGNDNLLSYEYDPMLMPVAEIEAESTLYEYDVERVDDYGNKSYYKTDRDRGYNRSDRKSKITQIKVWHKVSHILGTEEVFDYGLQHDIPRPKNEEARSSYHCIIIEGKSLCEAAQPHAKQVQLGYLQIQNMLAQASPPGLAVEWDALQGISLNKDGKGQDVLAKPMELLRIRKQKGDVIYNTTTARAHMQGRSTVPPIRDLKGSYDLTEYIAIIEHHINQIREITGVNDQGARGSGSATEARITFMTTDISLKTLHLAYLAVYESTAINASARLRDLLAYSEEAQEYYGSVLGINKVEMLNIVKDLPFSQLGIKISVNPSDEDKKAIHDAAIAAMKPGKNGTIIIGFGDYLLVKRMIDAGNIDQAQAYISYKEAEDDKKALEGQKMNEEMATERAKEQENLKSNNEMAKMEKETDEKLRYEQEMKKIKDELDEKAHQRRMDEIRLQNRIKEEQSQNQLQPA